MSDWQTITLGELCDAGGGDIRTGPFGSQLHEADYSEVGTPVVMPKDIATGRVDDATIARVSVEHVKRLAQHKLAIGDIVYGRRGDIGRKALITEREAGWLCGTGCLRITVGDQVDPRFLFYRLGQADTVADIRNRAVGATMPNLNTTILRDTSLTVPPFPTQRRIASILGAYDDLIEVNRRRIAVLEEMARGLFEEWFVRFRFPVLEGYEGSATEWPLFQLSDLAELCLGKMLDKNKNKGSMRPYLANINVRWGALGLDDLREMPFEDRELDRYGLRTGDIVMCEGGEPGRCAMWMDQMPGMMIQKALHRIRARDGIDRWFLYHDLFRKGRCGEFEKYFTGATIKHLPGEQLAKVKILLPPPFIQRRFGESVAPKMLMVQNLYSQNAHLAASRDLLLPRLISGQLSVEQAERELKAA